MNSPQAYTSVDFERYHRGEMTAAERHALEKAALDDPMLADALEGYAETTTAAADLLALQEQLQQRLDENRTRNVFFMAPRWMKIAALFLLFTGGGWLVLNTFTEKENNIATVGQPNRSLRPKSATDSATGQRVPPTIFADTLMPDNEVVALETNKNQTAASSKTSSPVLRQLPKKMQPESGATDKEDNNKETMSDIATLKSNTPANTGREAADTGRFDAMARQQTTDEVAGANSRRRMESVRAKSAAPADASPEGGWPAFEKYLSQNKKSINEPSKTTMGNSEVELQFDVDNNGRPANILVLKSVCKSCDAEAIRLLKEGPKWTGKRGRVKISF